LSRLIEINYIIVVVGKKNDINSSLLFSTYVFVSSVTLRCDLQLLSTHWRLLQYNTLLLLLLWCCFLHYCIPVFLFTCLLLRILVTSIGLQLKNVNPDAVLQPYSKWFLYLQIHMTIY